MTWFRSALADLPAGDALSAALVRERAADILRPAGALARFDEVAAWVAEWQCTASPAVHRPAALIFAASARIPTCSPSPIPIR
jgi:nicotinate-nucleotide--dimethylbenzimidazole phosphoribosyltransferase